MQGNAYSSDYYLCGGDRTYIFSTYKKNVWESRDHCGYKGGTMIVFDTQTVLDDMLFIGGEEIARTACNISVTRLDRKGFSVQFMNKVV